MMRMPWPDYYIGQLLERVCWSKHVHLCLCHNNINFCFFTSVSGNLLPKVSEKLNQAALPIIDFQTCSKPAYWWDTLRPSMICAGYESPDELKSACQVRGQAFKNRNNC